MICEKMRDDGEIASPACGLPAGIGELRGARPVSVAADQADRADPARRCSRYCRTRHRPEAFRDSRRAGRRRQSRGLQRQHRRRPGREIAARRLHAAARPGQPGRDQSAPVREDAVRSAEGSRTGRDPGREPVRARRQPVAAGEEFPGIHRIRAPYDAAAAVRFRRQRQPAPSVDGNIEAARRDRYAARAVQGRCAGDDGDRRRRHCGDVRRHVDGRPDQGRQAACAGSHGYEALDRSIPTCRR